MPATATKSCLLVLLALALCPAGAIAAQPAPSGWDVAAPPVPQGPTPPSDPWLVPPGTTRAQAAPESQAAEIASRNGLPPEAAPAMMHFFRPRRIAVSGSGGTNYVYTLGDVERIVSESAFLDSYAALTGSTKLERFRDPGARSIAGPVLAGGGVALAYVAGSLTIGCMGPGEGNSTATNSSPPCHPATGAGIAVGGLAAAVVGLALIFRARGEADDPQRHRIPFEQAQGIVQEYNRALLEHAAALIRAGDMRALYATPAPQRRPPARARWGVGPLGLAFRF